jgi:spore coat polysaccharide biosynthesis predicted glycosyltransferase SpsG
VRDAASRVLVTTGGSDPADLSLRILDALATVSADLHVRLVAGAANARLEALRRQAATHRQRVEILHDVDDMPALMAWADLAIAAAGSTTWELAFMELPGLLFSVAENQTWIATSVATAGSAIDLGWHEALGRSDLAQAVDDAIARPDQRRRLSAAGRRLVDGQGALRVASAMGAGAAATV